MLWLMTAPVPGSTRFHPAAVIAVPDAPAKAEHALDDRVADRDTELALGWPYCV